MDHRLFRLTEARRIPGNLRTEYVEGKELPNFRVLVASFNHEDSLYYAIPFMQDGEELYYNEKGNSLEGAFLKAPLDFYRISSRFSNSRFHPVLKRYRAHHGVDYAAPTGTPVYAIGNGKVIAKGFQAGGGGNYVKIRHNSVYETTYMHLSRFAKGLKVGNEVKQKRSYRLRRGNGAGYWASSRLSCLRAWKADKPAAYKIAAEETHQPDEYATVYRCARFVG